jgi:hypothetical protein
MKSKLFLAAATMVALLSAFIAVNQIKSASQASGHEDNKFGQFEAVPLEDAIGPESFAFDPHGGGPYTGVSDGRIIRWHQDQLRWINFAATSPQRYALPYLEHACIFNFFIYIYIYIYIYII